MRLLILPFLFVMQFSSIFAQSPPDSLARKMEQSLHTTGFTTDGTALAAYSIQARMTEHKVNGLSIAIIDHGKIVFTRGYGYRDASLSNARVDSTTLFQCASIGKMVTALAMLHLVKEGKIGLDDPIQQKLTGWKIPSSNGWEQKVTLRNILSHSAGFQDEYGFEGYIPHSSLPDVGQMLDSKPPANTRKQLLVKTMPGTVEKYSGGGFLILQKLVEDICGIPFSGYIDSVIFRPLKMQHSTYEFYPDEQLKVIVARGHDEYGMIDKKMKYRVYPESAAAGFWTTPNDLALLVLEMQQEYDGHSDRIADSRLLREMLTPQINTTGLGTHLKGYKDVGAFWHSGNNAGYTGLLYGTLNGQGAIVLCNSDSGVGLLSEIVRSVADAYGWITMATQYVKETKSPSYKMYVGKYSKETSLRATIGMDDNGLFLQIGGSGPHLTLYELADGSFLIKEKPDHFRLTFGKAPNGEVQDIRFQQDCGTKAGTLQRLK